jgi:DNA-binding IclR family transcriptional regulator
MVDFVGHRNLAHCTSCGKILLAAVPEVELNRLLEDVRLHGRTAQSITDPDRLRAELAIVRERGFAENISESTNSMASVAAPIYDHSSRVIAAISVAGPISRMGDAARRRYATLIVDTAGRISEQLGYCRPHQARTRSA